MVRYLLANQGQVARMPLKSSRKSTINQFPSNQHSRSRPSSPPLLPTLHEEPVAHSTSMMAVSSKPPQSRLHRLSRFLPLPESKKFEAYNSEDNHTVARKQVPTASPIMGAPKRATPSAPASASNLSDEIPSPPPPHTSTPHKLQKHSTIPIEPASARDASISPHTLDSRRPRAASLLPPVDMRSISDPIGSAPVSANTSDGETIEKVKKRRSWLPGVGCSKSRSRHVSQDLAAEASQAWISAGNNKIDYSLNVILGGDKIPELWDESPEANVYVYLFPRSTARGPQIKCHSNAFAFSQPLLDIIYDNPQLSASGGGKPRGRSFEGRDSLGIEDAAGNLMIRGGTPPIITPDNQSVSEYSGQSIKSSTDEPHDLHLYYSPEMISGDPPFGDQGVQSLVDARNLFAFFSGQPLVSTQYRPSIYHIFINIASALEKLEFSNQDGSSFGEEADGAFAFYCDDLKLTDIRDSRTKTVEGLVLGERMKCPELYSETFAHAVGKYVSIKSMDMMLFNELTPTTKLQLEQSYRDLVKKQNAASLRLADFNFPSIFSGIANSTSSTESKLIRFKNWKMNYVSMRKHALSFYKKKYEGAWPPKAGKDMAILQSGLNRIVLKQLYTDFCTLYDYLVDRKAFTTRGLQASDDREDELNPTTAALRKVMAEYDRSSPPVQPPIPFDSPRVPTIQTIDPTYPALSPKDQYKLSTRSLQEYEMLLLFAKSHNDDVNQHNGFLETYKAFELKEARGKNALELQEQRYGHWLFLYAIIQSLPMLVTDAPTLQYTNEVEYFLCQMPVNPRPWLEDGARANTSWYNIAGGGVVSLPSHLVDFSVEAVYGRSHCWKVAQGFLGDDSEVLSNQSPGDGLLSPLHPPPTFGDGELRPPSRGRQRSSRNVSAHASSASLGGYNGLESSQSRRQSRQAQRQSILGLQRIAGPSPGHDGGFFEERPRTSNGSSPNSRPMSRRDFGGMGVSPALDGRRGSSPMVGHGRRAGSGGGTSGELVTAGAQSGSTFDDILGSMNANRQQKVEKKKSIMGFF